jgi:hypothetical protein
VDEWVAPRECLITALNHLDVKNPSKRTAEPLCAWLTAAENINQTEWVGILKAPAELHMSAKCRDKVMMATMACCSRLSFQTKYVEETKCALVHWDEAWCARRTR